MSSQQEKKDIETDQEAEVIKNHTKKGIHKLINRKSRSSSSSSDSKSDSSDESRSNSSESVSK